MEAEQLPVTKSLAIRSLDRFMSFVAALASKYLTGPCSHSKIAAAAVLLSLLTTFPVYRGMGGGFKSVTSQAFSWKVLHPLSPIPADFKDPSLYKGTLAGQASHADKMELRVTLPILGRLSRTGVWTVAVWNPIAGFGTFYLLAFLASEALMDSVGAALFVLGLGPTFFGNWFFNDFIIGDGVAFFFMLLSVTWRSPLLSALSFLAAAFCDERCVTAAPLLLCYVAIRFREPDQLAQRKRSFAALASAILVWALLRWWLIHALGNSAGTSGMMSKEILRYQLMENLPGPFLAVFKSSWMLAAFALFSLAASHRGRIAVVLSASLGLAILPAFLIWDFERSVAYTFVSLLISLYSLRGAPALSRKYLAAILVTNMLLTAPGKSILRVLDWF
jgi:hypothetical protein